MEPTAPPLPVAKPVYEEWKTGNTLAQLETDRELATNLQDNLNRQYLSNETSIPEARQPLIIVRDYTQSNSDPDSLALGCCMGVSLISCMACNIL